MRADNSHHLIEASAARHANTLARAKRALQQLRDTAQPVSVTRLAREANVSRSWLYTQPELLAEIRQSPTTPTNSPSRHHTPSASAASLLSRLELAQQRINQLTDDNRRLRDQLARAHGQRRAERQTGPTRDRSNPGTTGPCS